MNDFEYKEFLLKQSNNSYIAGINIYLRYLYNKIEENFIGERILEIGAGAGLSRHFMNRKSCVLTDFLPWDDPKIHGLIDAQSLPFSDDYFDSAFALDSIHHISHPTLAVAELCRVVRPGGRIIIVEPYVSYLSFFIYKFFHNEKTTWNYKIPDNGENVSSTASDGEQSTLQSLLSNQNLISYFESRFEKKITFKRSYFSPVSFFATGGLTSPLPTPSIVIKFLIRLEALVPSRVLKLIAARQMLLIEVG